MRTTTSILTTPFLFAIAVVLCTVPAHAASPAIEWTYRNALTMSERGDDLEYVLVDLEAEAAARTQPMFDLMMELALVNSAYLPYSQVDLMRITRIVFRSADARYASAMERLARATADTGPYMRDQAKRREEVHDLAAKFVKQHSRESKPQYLPGSIDIGGMRAAYLAAAATAQHPPAYAEHLRALAPDALLDDLFGAAGAPDALHLGMVLGTYRGRRVQNENQMDLFYRGIGCAIYVYKRDIGWRLRQIIVDPPRFMGDIPNRCY